MVFYDFKHDLYRFYNLDFVNFLGVRKLTFKISYLARHWDEENGRRRRHKLRIFFDKKFDEGRSKHLSYIVTVDESCRFSYDLLTKP